MAVISDQLILLVSEGVPYPTVSIYGLRYFTRGLPNPKRYYHARRHYRGYYTKFPRCKW